MITETGEDFLDFFKQSIYDLFNSGTEILDNRGVHNEEQQANEESEETSTTSTSEESELGNNLNEECLLGELIQIFTFNAQRIC
jgi:hypothetical protein